jgi:ABC-type multidrug transport system fused ATPase/permease subunit
LVSAAVGALLGPAVQIISAPRSQLLEFTELFGRVQGQWVASAVGKGSIDAGTLFTWVPALLLAAGAARALLAAGLWFFWERTAELAAVAVRNDLATAYAGLDPAARRENDARDAEAQLSSGITTDVKLMREYIVHFYGGLPRDVAQVVLTGTSLAMLSPKLTLIFLAGIAPVVAVFNRIGRKLRRRAAAALADYSQLTEWLQQRLLGVETIKHYRTEDIEVAKMTELTGLLYERFLKAARVKARTAPMTQALATVSLAVVLVIALRDISTGAASGSVLMSFFATLALLTQPAGQLGRYLNSNREGAAAVDRLRVHLGFFGSRQRPVVAAAGGVRPVAPGAPARIICAGLTARYPGATEPALGGFSYTFAGGRIYCLAGPSGAGKSTLFNLLLGLIRPSAGGISLEASAAIPGDAAPICYMPQKVLLLPDTLAANVAYPDAIYDASRVAEALDRVGLGDLVKGLPGGVAARVGDGGIGVSGGQAQRVMLARLWYHQRPFVLVDEGTSALDPEVERTVYALLSELSRRGAVVVTIAHRRAAAIAADVLLLLDRGRLAAAGAPAEVMASAAYVRALG